MYSKIYFFTPADYPDLERMLKDALDTITKQTRKLGTRNMCIQFLRVYDDSPLPIHNWVNITGHMPGCFSNIGRNPYAPNVLNLSIIDGCFNYIGHPIHEMLHTLGVYHEQSRPDRDKYVRVFTYNVVDGNQ
jgi:hypothetical protein